MTKDIDKKVRELTDRIERIETKLNFIKVWCPNCEIVLTMKEKKMICPICDFSVEVE